MDWRIWLALGIGAVLGANLGVLLMGLLVASREDKEKKELMTFERSGYGNLN